MILSNSHPVAASVTVAEIPGHPAQRFGMVVAKTTYQVTGSTCTIDPARLHPLLPGDLETPLGILPRDDLPRSDHAFEVILLGHAHAPGGVSCERLIVSLTVGDVRQDLIVHGDRRWESSLLRKRPGAVAPFSTMPLTWSRAFGGKSQIEIDQEAFMDVCDVRNPAGRGFDHARDAVSLGKHLKSPKGYPRFDQERWLPNLERPQELVTRWDDAPEPACWATVPMTSSIHGLRIPSVPGKPEAGPGLFHRASPDWVLPQAPPAGAQITLTGATREGTWTFALPRVQVMLDVHAGDAVSSVTTQPQMLVLLPDERSFYIVHRGFFTAPPPAGDTRTARLRVQEGWAGS